MKGYGCTNGCAHRKPVKIQEMAGSYSFRCTHYNKYMRDEEIRVSCKYYRPPVSVKVHSLEEFL